MNRWRSVVAGRVNARKKAAAMVLADAVSEVLPDEDRRVRGRRYTKEDAIARRKRIAKRRAKKGYG